jgi:hypothetical protein
MKFFGVFGMIENIFSLTKKPFFFVCFEKWFMFLNFVNYFSSLSFSDPSQTARPTSKVAKKLPTIVRRRSFLYEPNAKKYFLRNHVFLKNVFVENIF